MYWQQQAADSLEKGVEEARGDINRLYPQAQDMTRQGFAGAMDIFNQATPQQMQSFQQGNVGAQNALLSGLPQMNNAILGGPIDYSQLQAQQLQMPEFNFQQPAFLQAPPTPPPQQFSQYDYNTPQPIMNNQGGFGGLFSGLVNQVVNQAQQNPTMNNQRSYGGRMGGQQNTRIR